MRSSIKILLSAWLILLLAVAALFYNAYSRLKPEMLISLLSTQVEKNYPGTQLEVEKVDYKLSVDFNMALKKIRLKRAAKVIGSLEEIDIRIPWWLLIFQRGNAQINLNGLSIYLDEVKTQSAASVGTLSASPAAAKSSSRIKLDVPDYLTNTQFTLRAKDVTVMDIARSRRYFTLSKLLVKEFKYGKNSAFELIIPLSITHNRNVIQSELWMFGDITPGADEWKLKFNGEFRSHYSESSDKSQFEDLIIDGKSSFRPHELNLSADLDFFVDKEKIGDGRLTGTEQELGIILSFTKFPLNFLSIFEKEIKGPHLPDMNVRSQGKIEIRRNLEADSLKLTGNLNFPGTFRAGIDQATEVTGKWRLTFNDARWDSSFITPKGEVSFFRRAVIDFKTGKVEQYFEELGFTEMVFANAIKFVEGLHHIRTTEARPYSSTSVSFKKCLAGERRINGTIKYGTTPAQRFYLAELTEGTSHLNVNYQFEGKHEKLSVNVNRFSWGPELSILRPYFEAEAGVVDAKIEGRWPLDWKSGQWLGSLKITKANGVSGEVAKFQQEFWKTFSLEDSLVVDQSWNGTVKNDLLAIDIWLLDGANPARITGSLNLKDYKKSHLTLAYPKNRKWKPVRKEISEPFWEKAVQ